MSGTLDPLAQAALEKTMAEAMKIRAEASDLGRHPFARPSSWIPLLLAVGAAVGGLITGYYAWQVKRVEVDAAVTQAERRALLADRSVLAADRQKFEAEQSVARLRDEVRQLEENQRRLRADNERLRIDGDAAARQVAQAVDQTEDVRRQLAQVPGIGAAQQELTQATQQLGEVSRQLAQRTSRVFLHFRGSIERATMRELQTALEREGFIVPGIERIASDYRTEVRYFHAGDEALARDVATRMTAFFAAACPLPAPAPARLVQVRTQVPRGQIEVWVSHNCPRPD